MNFLKQLWRIAESFAVRLEKNRLLLIAGFSVLYWIFTYVLAGRKLLWNDELFTYYIARLPTMTDVWGALMSGGEQLPPFFYVLTRASTALFGLNDFALRLPEMIGFWVMCVCLFFFAARRISNFYALLAPIFPLVTYTYYYAFEARPYGLVLGFSALALLCWQSATMNLLRPLSVVCLSISLAGALSSHYYGIFAILPLALGEAVRTAFRRRLDAPVWAAFCLAVAPLVLHLPLIRQARASAGEFWAKPQWLDVPNFYTNMFFPTILALILLLFVSGIYQIIRRDKTLDESHPAPKIEPPIHEVAAALGFIIIPIICIIQGKFVTGGFTDRYAVIAIIGFSVLIAFIAAKINNNDILISAVLIICFLGCFRLLALKEIWKVERNSRALTKIQLLQRKGVENLPIVAADAHTFIELNHYAPEISPRVVYLADPEISLRRINQNSVERGVVDLLKPWFGLNVTDYKSYIAARPQFLLCGDPQFFSWIVPQLEEDGMQLELKGSEGGTMLFLVSPPGQETARNR
jgi:4-amino-4-deoxy-L-arabinose transferase-like glycosyltransferase